MKQTADMEHLSCLCSWPDWISILFGVFQFGHMNIKEHYLIAERVIGNPLRAF